MNDEVMLLRVIQILLLVLSLTTIFALAGFTTELEALSTTQLKQAESALIVEMKERTGTTYEPSEISRFAFTEKKKAYDKSLLVERVSKLISAKLEVNKRSEKRVIDKEFNGLAAINITKIKVTSHTKHNFDHLTAQSVILPKGGITKNEIVSDNAKFSLIYRVTYGEDGVIRVQGVKVNSSGITSFEVKHGNDYFKIYATVTYSLSGWN
jgi:hypothetical protein